VTKNAQQKKLLNKMPMLTTNILKPHNNVCELVPNFADICFYIITIYMLKFS